MKKIVLASGNAGKLREFQQLLNGCGFDVVPQSDFFSESAEETGLTFVENAIIKARYACAKTGLPAIADDIDDGASNDWRRRLLLRQRRTTSVRHRRRWHGRGVASRGRGKLRFSNIRIWRPFRPGCRGQRLGSALPDSEC
jgi:hypothetical protein